METGITEQQECSNRDCRSRNRMESGLGSYGRRDMHPLQDPGNVAEGDVIVAAVVLPSLRGPARKWQRALPAGSGRVSAKPSESRGETLTWMLAW